MANANGDLRRALGLEKPLTAREARLESEVGPRVAYAIPECVALSREPHELLPLDLLTAGQSGRVHEVVGPRDEVHRLEEMGLRRGTHIEVVQPGSPCIIRLAGHQICFRPGEAGHVLVEPGPSP